MLADTFESIFELLTQHVIAVKFACHAFCMIALRIIYLSLNSYINLRKEFIVCLILTKLEGILHFSTVKYRYDD